MSKVSTDRLMEVKFHLYLLVVMSWYHLLSIYNLCCELLSKWGEATDVGEQDGHVLVGLYVLLTAHSGTKSYKNLLIQPPKNTTK